MIKINSLSYVGNGKFSLQFSDGQVGIFDFSVYAQSRSGSLLQPLSGEALLAAAFVDAGAMAWPHGLELAPERIYELCEIIKRAA